MPIKLLNLDVRQYDRILKQCELTFSDSQNLFIGENGSGKSTYLKIIEAAINSNFNTIKNCAFDFSYTLNVAIKGHPNPVIVNVTASNQKIADTNSTSTENGIPLSAPSEWKFSFEAKFMIAKSVVATVICADGKLKLQDHPNNTVFERDFAINHMNLFRLVDTKNLPTDEHKEILSRTLGSLSIWLNPSLRLQEGLEDFLAFTSSLEFQITRENNTTQSFQFPGNQSDWPLFMMMTRLITLTGTPPDQEILIERDTPSIQHIVKSAQLLDALNARSLKLRPKLASSKVEGNVTTYNFRGVDLWVDFKTGETVAGAQLTYGQKRFITIYLLILQNRELAHIIDELDNGFHPEFTKLIMNLTSDRQAFYSSHDALLINSVNFSSASDVDKKIHFCKRFENGTVGINRLPQEKLNEIYQKISVGILRPSDIFHDENLW